MKKRVEKIVEKMTPEQEQEFRNSAIASAIHCLREINETVVDTTSVVSWMITIIQNSNCIYQRELVNVIMKRGRAILRKKR